MKLSSNRLKTHRMCSCENCYMYKIFQFSNQILKGGIFKIPYNLHRGYLKKMSNDG